MTLSPSIIFRRYVALPTDHGSWVFLLSPLLIGLFAGGRWSTVDWLLIVAALAAFLLRQPVTILVKVFSGRRPNDDLTAAYFWGGLYASMGALALMGLMLLGAGFLLYLTLPALSVFVWHLYLVSRRSERRQMGVELVGSGVLALAAPAAYWVAVGSLEGRGWLLWALTWAQSAASIVYAYLRLEQRPLSETPSLATRWQMGQRALLYAAVNVIGVAILAILNVISIWMLLPFGLQLVETVYGTLRPAVGWKPTAIGFRQLIVSSLFTVFFILSWR